jgi:hypothetical protein
MSTFGNVFLRVIAKVAAPAIAFFKNAAFRRQVFVQASKGVMKLVAATALTEMAVRHFEHKPPEDRPDAAYEEALRAEGLDPNGTASEADLPKVASALVKLGNSKEAVAAFLEEYKAAAAARQTMGKAIDTSVEQVSLAAAKSVEGRITGQQVAGSADTVVDAMRVVSNTTGMTMSNVVSFTDKMRTLLGTSQETLNTVAHIGDLYRR